MNYSNFIWQNKRFLGFGFVLTLFSAFGQTFFLSLFNPYIQNSLQISNGKLGLIYALATFASALLMTQLGRKIDALDLKLYTSLVGIGLIFATSSMAIAASTFWLFLSYILLRLIGQGLMCHVSMVSMARYFTEHRGRALSLAALGYPLGQALFPILIALSMTILSWRNTWWVIALFSFLFVLPLLLWLLTGHEERHKKYMALQTDTSHSTSALMKPTYIFQDWRFYVIACGILATGFINTGIFFQYNPLIVSRGWSLHEYATSFVTFALGNIVGSLLTGLMIDRFRAVNVLTFYLAPLLLGLIVLRYFYAAFALFIFMFATGITQGASSVIISAVWSELYGSRYLGSIRSWVISLKVLSTGLAPALFGYLLDSGVKINGILTLCLNYLLLSIGLLIIVRIYGIKDKFYF